MAREEDLFKWTTRKGLGEPRSLEAIFSSISSLQLLSRPESKLPQCMVMLIGLPVVHRHRKCPSPGKQALSRRHHVGSWHPKGGCKHSPRFKFHCLEAGEMTQQEERRALSKSAPPQRTMESISRKQENSPDWDSAQSLEPDLPKRILPPFPPKQPIYSSPPEYHCMRKPRAKLKLTPCLPGTRK